MTGIEMFCTLLDPGEAGDTATNPLADINNTRQNSAVSA